MEPAELVSDNKEHAKGLLRVLDLGEEVRRETEGERDFGGLVEIRFEDVSNKGINTSAKNAN